MDSVVPIFRILALADIHGNVSAVLKLLSILERENKHPNLVLIAGDLPETTPIGLMLQYILTHGNLSKSKYTRWVYKGHGRPQFVQRQIESAKVVLALLGSLDVPIVYVPGNVDCHETQSLISNVLSPKLHFLNASVKEFGSVRILGVGGSQFSAQRYREPLCDMEIYRDDFVSHLAPFFKIAKRKTSLLDILLVHESPAFRYYTGKGVIIGGSKAISDLITYVKPKFTIFGHYHEYPLVKKGVNTIYVNPGPLTCYLYAIIDIDRKKIHVTLKKMNSGRFDFKNIIYGYRMASSNFKQNFKFD